MRFGSKCDLFAAAIFNFFFLFWATSSKGCIFSLQRVFNRNLGFVSHMEILDPQPVRNINQIPGGWGTPPLSCSFPFPCLSVYLYTQHRIGLLIIAGKPLVLWFLSLELSLQPRKEPAQDLEESHPCALWKAAGCSPWGDLPHLFLSPPCQCFQNTWICVLC